MKSGIYKITVNNNIYVGSSKNINRRYWEHLWKLKKGKHSNKHLQNLYNKYKEENFELTVLEHCDVVHLIKNEQKWINLLKPSINKAPVSGTTLGLKLTKEQCKTRSKNNIGRKHSPESIQKRVNKIKGRKYTDTHKANISASLSGKPQNKNTIKNRVEKCKKPIACYDLHNTIIQIYDSAKTAALKNGIHATNITRCCKNKIKTYKNMIWRYHNG
jgi:group I intron endonuclease